MKLYGKEYTKDGLRQHIGDISQVAGIKSFTFNEGLAKGVNAFEVKTGSGFVFTVLPDRGMDIAWMDFKGIPISYITKAGITGSQYYHPQGFEWLRSFFGGMLTTCGLTHTGPPGKDGKWDLGLHGRISNIPASEISHSMEWQGDNLILSVSGKMKEAVLYEENLLLSRKIITYGGENRLILNDKIENQGYQETPFMIMYHTNVGFPVISENSRLIAPIISTEARDEDAEPGKEHCQTFESPAADFNEQVFFHKLAADNNGNTCAGIINEALGIGYYIKFNNNELPVLTEWKMTGQQEYVVGIEPANCLPIGRTALRESGGLMRIKPGEKRNITIEIGVLASIDEIDEFIAYSNSLTNNLKKLSYN